MADSKKYDGSQWEHSLRKLTTATEAVENPLYSDGTAITSYTIKGNTVQDGTPTPSNPVAVNGVGDKTANLLNINTSVRGYYINASGVEVANTSSEYEFAHTQKIPVEPNMTYTYSLSVQRLGMYRRIIGYDANGDFIEQITDFNITALGYHTTTITMPQNCYYITINYVDDAYNNADLNMMLNVGSTAQSYEPWGYKIPVITSQGSAVNYLGSVSSNRQIAKYEFTGLETFYYKSSTYQGSFYVSWVSLGGKRNQMFLCDRAKNVSSISNYAYGKCYSDSSMNLWLGEASWSTQDFKDYLAEQYASGTPVTIYYVLNEATTGIVNEPLMKIGDYSDSISNAAAIPTTEGANTITVDTTVQPSEFTATWTGWHDSSVEEWDGSQWQ